MTEETRPLPGWCDVDDCPTEICGGPHIEVETTMGTEILRPDQTPFGKARIDDTRCNREGCPTPDNINHWHCARCKSPKPTSYQGHYGSQDGGKTWGFSCVADDSTS